MIFIVLGDTILQHSPKDADIIIHVVSHIASKWKIFARQVGLRDSVLGEIEMNYHGQCQICFRKAIDRWRQNDTPPYTWEKVLSVLYSETVRGYEAGEQVYKHLRKELGGEPEEYVVISGFASP